MPAKSNLQPLANKIEFSANLAFKRAKMCDDDDELRQKKTICDGFQNMCVDC